MSYSQPLEVLQQLDHDQVIGPDELREQAIAQGRIADDLEARGQLDEALRIRREELLPAYERLGDPHATAVTQGQIADILQMRGQLDAALRIRTEDQLPVYERLGDLRAKAITQGKIADVLEARGQLDAALALQAQRLPVAQRMQDRDSLAHTKFSMARIRLARGDHRRSALRRAFHLLRGEPRNAALEEIEADLSEAFALSIELARTDYIGAIGQLLAQVQAMGGYRAEALQTFDQAETAFRKLNNEQGLAHVRLLRERISYAA